MAKKAAELTAVKARRKHRRVRTSWSGCGCPDGTKRVSVKATKRNARGWSCIQNTAKGARYVKASCNGEQTSGDQEFRRPQTALLTHTGRVSASDGRRGGKIDWSVCGCPDGATLKKTAKGKRCQKAGKFVKAVCP